MKKKEIAIKVLVFIFILLFTAGCDFFKILNFDEWREVKGADASSDYFSSSSLSSSSSSLSSSSSSLSSSSSTGTTLDISSVGYKDLSIFPNGAFLQSNGSVEFKHTIDSFRIGQFEVTYELWHTVRIWAEANGYKFLNKGREGSDGVENGIPPSFDNNKYRPVTTISWEDAVVWCNAYSEGMYLQPCYYLGGSVLKDSTLPNLYSVEWNKVNNGYRLPTEAEWEYAARWCGNIQPIGSEYYEGSYWTPWDFASGTSKNTTDSYETDKVAWYQANSGGTAQQVSNKSHNFSGLYDMSGNVSELCWDSYEEYDNTEKTDYAGAISGVNKVYRGGSFFDPSSYLACGYRDGYHSTNKYVNIGFRIARTN